MGPLTPAQVPLPDGLRAATGDDAMSYTADILESVMSRTWRDRIASVRKAVTEAKAVIGQDTLVGIEQTMALQKLCEAELWAIEAIARAVE